MVEVDGVNTEFLFVLISYQYFNFVFEYLSDSVLSGDQIMF